MNVRDLGGLPVAGGGSTVFGAVVRSDNPASLAPAGWRALEAYGVRRIVALRTRGSVDDEPPHSMVPPSVTLQRVVVEDSDDAEFVRRCVLTGSFSTPIYFRQMLSGWPEFCAAGVAAVAEADPGSGVVVSCARGRDRTGLVTFLLLALVGVTPEAIAQDWWMSVENLRDREPGYEQVLHELLQQEGTTARDTIAETLDATDIIGRLTAGGLTTAHIDAIRARLLGP